MSCNISLTPCPSPSCPVSAGPCVDLCLRHSCDLVDLMGTCSRKQPDSSGTRLYHITHHLEHIHRKIKWCCFWHFRDSTKWILYWAHWHINIFHLRNEMRPGTPDTGQDAGTDKTGHWGHRTAHRSPLMVRWTHYTVWDIAAHCKLQRNRAEG